MKPKAVEEGVNKTQLTVLPLDRVEQFRLASEEIRWWTQCRSGDLADFPGLWRAADGLRERDQPPT